MYKYIILYWYKLFYFLIINNFSKTCICVISPLTAVRNLKFTRITTCISTNDNKRMNKMIWNHTPRTTRQSAAGQPTTDCFEHATRVMSSPYWRISRRSRHYRHCVRYTRSFLFLIFHENVFFFFLTNNIIISIFYTIYYIIHVLSSSLNLNV